ncbi:MAG: hypothetical protein GY894_03975 [Planctomycetes bacterium]|nr:hypothetical protein [Planctomycetota bacterium]MCP4838506.1 hypothetical protein [Planctomycetota bacterium]
MTTDGTTPNWDHLMEARCSKPRARKALQTMVEEHLVVDDQLPTDADLSTSLFTELPWRDPSPSGEFEAIQA